jgi:hypothetical protein
MSSMPQLVSGNQDDSANEVILGVDTTVTCTSPRSSRRWGCC